MAKIQHIAWKLVIWYEKKHKSLKNSKMNLFSIQINTIRLYKNPISSRFKYRRFAVIVCLFIALNSMYVGCVFVGAWLSSRISDIKNRMTEVLSAFKMQLVYLNSLGGVLDDGFDYDLLRYLWFF